MTYKVGDIVHWIDGYSKTGKIVAVLDNGLYIVECSNGVDAGQLSYWEPPQE